MPHVFVFGLGFCGRVIARRMAAAGWTVTATVRAGDCAGVPGVRTLVFDPDHPLDARVLHGVTHLVSTIPPGPLGDPVLPFLAAAGVTWAGYLSTTGVYGDFGGETVDETTPPRPTQERSHRRLAAERAWLASGLSAHIFRLAGIYGPGRNALEQVRAGTARRIVKPGHAFGRIHVEDVAGVIEASIHRPNPGAIYNVADDDPAPQAEVIAFACRLLGQDPPEEEDWDTAQATLSPMARSFWADNKRVATGRIKTELGVRLTYPSYRDGLSADFNAPDRSDR